jgi:hypothetical protein
VEYVLEDGGAAVIEIVSLRVVAGIENLAEIDLGKSAVDGIGA